MAKNVKLKKDNLKEIRKIDPRLVSYNVEMTEVTGGTFWKEYTPEEVAGRGGAYVCANKINPDYALVIDVNLADAPGVPSRESVQMGGGISISYSSATDRALTRASAELCERVGVDYIKKVESSSTGTNAIAVSLAGCGVSVVDVGLPLRNMHTDIEVVDIADLNTVCDLLEAYILTGGVLNA